LDIGNDPENPMTPDYPRPPFPTQRQPMPGSTDAMRPRPDHSYTSGTTVAVTGGKPFI
jgi:hypothetical protein